MDKVLEATPGQPGHQRDILYSSLSSVLRSMLALRAFQVVLRLFIALLQPTAWGFEATLALQCDVRRCRLLCFILSISIRGEAQRLAAAASSSLKQLAASHLVAQHDPKSLPLNCFAEG